MFGGRLPPAGIGGGNYLSFRANSSPPPNPVVPRGRRGVRGRDVVVRRKARFCCFFTGNRLARESGGTCTRRMVQGAGGAVTCWPGRISLLLTVPTLHAHHSCREARKTSPAAKLLHRETILDSLPLNLPLITGSRELKAANSEKTFIHTYEA